MGLETGISWCHATWNPWQGCTKVSAECARCYMFRDKLRYGQDPTAVVRSAPGTFRLPLTRHGPTATKGTPGAHKLAPGLRVFTCSWSDWFHEAADPWRDEAWEVIRQRPDLTFLILTKRPERIPGHLPAGWGSGWPNVWLGTTVGVQRSVWRLYDLATVPAAVRFVSVEPLLERVFFGGVLADLDWMIIGGESGPGARPMAPAWARRARDQAQEAGLAVHFKQWGEHAPLDALSPAVIARMQGWSPADLQERSPQVDGEVVYRVGVEAAGRLLDGQVWDALPRRAA